MTFTLCTGTPTRFLFSSLTSGMNMIAGLLLKKNGKKGFTSLDSANGTWAQNVKKFSATDAQFLKTVSSLKFGMENSSYRTASSFGVPRIENEDKTWNVWQNAPLKRNLVRLFSIQNLSGWVQGFLLISGRNDARNVGFVTHLNTRTEDSNWWQSNVFREWFLCRENKLK